MIKVPQFVSDEEWEAFLQFSSRLKRENKIGVSAIWTYKEWRNGILVREHRVKNLLTNYGLTALASAPNGAYLAPEFLVIEANGQGLSSTYSAGVSAIQIPARVDLGGDTQIVLGAGLASQETVTFTSVTGSSPYTYNLSGTTVNPHTSGDLVVRQVNVNDTMSSVVSEQQYDSVNFPSTRMQSPGGYSAGSGNWTIQFYFPGSSANILFTTCGLSDSQTVGAGNLHNHFILGVSHVSTSNDIEIDGSITLVNN